MEALGNLRGVISRYLPVSGDLASITDSRTWALVRECLLCLLLVLLVFHIYAHSKDGPFVFDDLHNIADNPYIKISRLDLESLRAAAFKSPIPTRPVANLSFALNFYFNQLNERSFRIVNVLFHLGNGLVLLLLLKATLLTPALRERYRDINRFMPYVAVTIWIVNPLHTQSVSYIVQRMNSMAAFFCLLSFLLYVYARLARQSPRSLFLAIVSGLVFLLALGCKENSITLPFFIFLYEWFFFRDLDLDWLKKNLFWPLLILIFWVGMALVYLGSSPVDNIVAGYQSRDFTLMQRVMTQSRVVIFYIFLFLFPHPSRLNLDHYFPVSGSLLDPPTTILSILAIATLLAFAIFSAKRERLLSFCVLWFLGNLVVESSVIGLEMVFEHRTYLPSVMVAVLVTILLYRSIPHIWLRRAVYVFIVAMGVIWTHERNLLWGDDVALWRDSVRKSPQKARPYANLGIAYGEKGNIEKAIDFLERAVQIKPDYEKPHFNLALTLIGRGDYKKGDFYTAEKHARTLLEKNPNDAEVLNILAISLANQNKFEMALDNFYRVLQIEPEDEYTHFYTAQILARTGRLEEAGAHFGEALRLKPDYQEALIELRRVRQRLRQRHFGINNVSEDS